ncbi:MAG: hypothetical protein K2P12_01785 [Clostridia bacterium]|nr:hypothetical protein [Clostridia bacterium]
MWNKNQELIQSFKSLYAELEKSQFIMSNKIITNILKFVTSNEPFLFAFKHANENFSFESIYQEATANGKIKMPDDDYKIIVLVTGLLFAIDRGNIEYLSFLKNTFPRLNIADSFLDFCSGVVLPYVQAFERVLSQADRIVDAENQVHIKNMPRQLVDLLQNNIISISEQLVSDKTLPDVRRQEIFVILEGLSFAVDSGDVMLIKSLWLGLKYALLANKAYTSQVKAFENELKNYSII